MIKVQTILIMIMIQTAIIILLIILVVNTDRFCVLFCFDRNYTKIVGQVIDKDMIKTNVIIISRDL